MIRLLLFLSAAAAVSLTSFAAPTQPLVILVAIDGCRWDYPEKHDAPFLRELSADGVRMERLTPSYPSKTFPNHYTLVTGLRPESHGIIQNRFYDPAFEAWFGIGAHPAAREGRWWGGEPVWLTAQRQGLRAACMFWPGSEADIQGLHPDHWLRYDDRISEMDRVQRVLTWTAQPAAERPHLITLYFEAVDSAGHRFGPAAPETGRALHRIDAALRTLRDGLAAQGLWQHTHLIVTADHGMTWCDPAHTVVLEDLVDPTSIETVFFGASAGLNLKSGDLAATVARLNAHPHLHAFAREDVPARLHFSHNTRIPDIVVVPDLGWHLSNRAWVERQRDREPDYGDHGYDPAEPDMGAVFLAHGPGFAPGTTWPVTDNIHVYNLLCALLGVTPAANEGDARLAARWQE